MAAVLMKTGTPSELLELLQSDSLEAVKVQDPEHFETLRLEAAKAAPDSPLAQSRIETMLTELTAGKATSDDDRAFASMVGSAISADQQKIRLSQLEKIIEAHSEHRQAQLARLDLLCKLSEEDKRLNKSFIEACVQYYRLFSNKAFCFDDLIPRLRRMGTPIVKDFANSLVRENDSPSPSQQLFNLKMDYNILFGDEASASEVLEYIMRALTFFNTTQDDPSAAEAGLLAAMALLEAYLESNEIGFMLQSSMVLHTASLRFKDYYPLRVLLMQLQMISGHMHLGMHNFIRLSIKNLQWETLGHFVLTRISTLHPCQQGRGEESANPIALLDTALTIFDNSQRSLNRALSDGLKNGSYGNVIDTVEVRTRLEQSIAKQIYIVEERKCQRALKIPAIPKFEPYKGRLSDLRDDSFMPVYGLESQGVTQLLRCGPRPGQGWLSAMTLQESLMTYLMAEAGAPHPSIIGTAVQILKELEPKIDIDASDLTKDEREQLLVNQDLTKAVLSIAAKESDGAVHLESAIKRVTSDQQEDQAMEINGVLFPDWRYLHNRLVRLETLQNMAHFSAIMLQKFKQEKDKVKSGTTNDLRKLLDGLRKPIDEKANAIHKQAKELKEQLSASGVLGKLVDAVLGRTDIEDTACSGLLSELQDQAAVEEYCGSMRESWEDALDGILSVKIKTI